MEAIRSRSPRNLIQVDEPNPSGGTVSTTYTYNLRDQLTDVSMTRSGTTQHGTFNYDLATWTENLKYFPYGEEGTTTAQNRDKFPTYYRDELTALDYAQNRYYTSGHGRFTSPDADGGSGSSPQSLNRYAYLSGDPVNKNDPSG